MSGPPAATAGTGTAARVVVEPGFEAPVQTDVLIVGAGACGLVAALLLADLGVEAVVLERDAQPSGSTSLSSGFIPAAGTRTQQALGVQDSAERFAEDIQAKAHGTAASALVAAYTQAIAPALDHLESRHGLQWEVLTGFLYPGHSRHRMHTLAARTGVALEQALEAAVEAAAVPILCEAQATELVVDAARRVLGVRARRPDGSVEAVGCRALLLACNGYGGAPALVRRYIPEMAEATFGGHTGNDGTALHWGEALGAHLADMRAYQGHGSWAVPHGVLMTWALMVEGGVQINREGRRFHDESQGYSEAALHVVAQPGGIAWNVFDTPVHALAQGFPDFVDAERAGAVRRADSLEALAGLIGCDPATLGETLSAWTPGEPDAFGRRLPRRLDAPFYAVKVTGALFHTQGGLDIDARTRVLDGQGQPLPNLWAAGGAARGVSGNHVSGYLSGNGLLSAVAGGYIAAHDMAAFLRTSTST
ncbi:MAG: FAD-dependent oxidoreductase [Gammaproteobacteria bacterium]|uniref:FAD-dependent oxidoreductase n=1 Tax=Pseudacidovorax sp. TaxID=1934311 RepID=UPI001B628617|nr:FAD-dependent oxidoreductase [Pseudacidovorax sp.]MBP6897172.1 FAD-binding protein [Pseudacidovorax sp.]